MASNINKSPSSSQNAPRILLAGGGTGGHVYPAIAIADAIKVLDPRAVIAFAGTKDRMEWEAVPKAGYEIHAITVTGLQRSLSFNSLKRNLMFPFKLMKGMMQARKLVQNFDPDVVIGTGGYVSGPILKAASKSNIPFVIQEQNAYAGMTNKLMAKQAAHIHIAFEEAKQYFPPEKCVLSGNPTRKSLQQVDRKEARAFWNIPESATVLLMFGGSLGSNVLNDAMKRSLEKLLAQENLYILWQTGKNWFDRLNQELPKYPRLNLMKYVERMDFAYAAADLTVCRAGAISCSELMVTGSASVLIPSPHVAEDHQTKNAKAMEHTGAAKLLPEQELYTDFGFLASIEEMLKDKAALESMRKAASDMAKPNAAQDIAKDVLSLIKK
jgi:UDP-N-acetylglucosamine--N-acetylmuramyl-(pentapeptide) pyrophosphoryl-undecaprenol N-acetylglucosamine transferase